MANVIQFSIEAVDKFSTQFTSLRSNINKTAKLAAGFGVAFAAGAAVASKAIIDVGSTTENLRLRMNAMLGDVAEGNKVFQDMSKFAGEVPFAYEEIMNSATQLSGILKGGSQEIAATMPMIADLAAVSGLSIQKTTEQVSRMFSAGAGSADLFREQGILAMLGFEAGVSISAEETKKKLIEAFESPLSKFRGAATEMATTWDGIMSMIGDKWFNIKAQIADEGLFNYFKALATVINDLMGQALDNTRENAAVWSNSLIDGIRSVSNAVGFLADMFRGLEVVWEGLKFAFAKVAEGIYIGIDKMAESMRFWMNMIPGINIEKFETIGRILKGAKERSDELGQSLQDLALKPLPSESIDAYMVKVEATFKKLQDMSLAATTAIKDVSKAAANDAKIASDKLAEDYKVFLEGMGLSTATFGEQFKTIMGSAIESVSDGMAQAIVAGESLQDSFRKIGRQILAQLVSMLIKMGIQRLVFSAITSGAVATESAQALGASNALAFSNAFASTAAIPIVGPALAPGVAAAASAANLAGSAAAGAAGAALGGIAHGGLTNVPAESTFLLQKGERVVSPNQNKDLTEFMSGGTGGNSVTINIYAHDTQSVEDLFTNNSSLIYNTVIEAMKDEGR